MPQRIPKSGFRDIAFIVIAMMTAACGGESTTRIASRDSAGVAIVTTDVSRSDVRPCPSLLAGVRRTIVSPDFFRLRGAVVTSDSTVAVLVGGTAQVEFFSLDDGRLLTKTRRGEGPGELEAPGTLARFAPDSIAVNDDEAGRISVFDGFGRFIRSFPLPSRLVPSFLMAATIHGNLLIEPSSGFDINSRPGLHRDTMPLLMYTSTGRFVDTVAQVVSGESLVTRTAHSMSVTEPVLARYSAVAVLGPDLIIADNAKPQLAFVNAGRTMQLIKLMGLQGRMTRGIFDYAVDHAVRRTLNPRSRALLAAQYRSERLPPLLPAFAAVLTTKGEVWVERYNVTAGAERQWVVLTPSGRLICDATAPPGFTLADMERRVMVGIAADSNGIESVVVAAREPLKPD